MSKSNILSRLFPNAAPPKTCVSLWDKTGTPRVLRFIERHPYLSAFGFCLFGNALFFGSMGNLQQNTCYLLTLLLLAAGIWLVWRWKQSCTLPRPVTWGICAAWTAVLLFLAYQFQKSESRQLWILWGGIALAALLYLGLRAKRYRTGAFRLSAWILCTGFVLKVYYVLCSSIYTRQHDVGTFDLDQSHAGYINYFLQNHALPDFDPTTRYQFYHPPLHHILSAAWIEMSEKIFGIGYDPARESLQTLTLFYAMTIIITSYRLLRHFRLKGIALYLPLLLISFHPTFILFSGSINNDILSVAFVVGAMFCTIRWYDNQTLPGLLKIALCVGLGMMTKMSSALVAIPIAAVFLVVLVQRLRQKRWRIFGEYGLFLLVCAPLGLWYPVRNLIRFGVPINYVQELPVTTFQYLGHMSFWDRIRDFSAHQFESVYEQWTTNGSSYNEYNPLIAVMKNAVFGEYINEGCFPDTAAGAFYVHVGEVLFWLNVVLAAAALIAMLVFCFRKCSLSPVPKYFLVGFSLFQLVNLYTLSYQYPFSCSSNFRYIMPTCIIGAIFLGVTVQQWQSSGKTVGKVLSYGMLAMGLLFACLVFFFYQGVGLYAS